MSREEFEQSETNFWQSEFPRGPGDPDFYGYPGEPKDEGVQTDGTNTIDLEFIPF